MPRRDDIHTILVIGSGPIVIGQACEFDYSGTQACRVLREEGYRVVLANSNPATIMTDPDFADRTYIEPLTPEVLASIIERERPDAVLPDARRPDRPQRRHGPLRPGSDRRPGHARDDRRQRRGHRHRRGPRAVQGGDGRDRPRRARAPASPTPSTRRCTIAADIGLPIIIRPAYILGGRGTGIAATMEQLERLAADGIAASPIGEILVEESIAGWKEFELEVMRDRADNCVIICSIENVDPMGVHTGDSITVAPAQTLTDVEYQAMRDAAFACIRRVGVETGGSNVQFALDPVDGRMVVIEMNPRVSRVERAGVEGDRLPDRQDRRPPRRRLHARRDPQRHHQGHAGQLRAGHRLRRHEDPALGVREAARHDRRSSARRCSRSARRWRSGARSPRACRRRCARWSRAASASTPTPPRPSSRRSPTPTCWRRSPCRRRTARSRSASCCGAASTSSAIHDACRIDLWFLDQMLAIIEERHALAALAGPDDLEPRGWKRAKRLGFADAQLAHLWGARRRPTSAPPARPPASTRRTRPSTRAPPSSPPRRRTTTRRGRTRTRCGRRTGRAS